MPQTIRKYWRAHKGRVTLNYNWPAIDQESVVVVTASEYNNEHVRFIGAASITVANIAPHGPPYDPNHGVTFVVNVDWGSPLNIVTDITLLDDKPIETQTYVPPMPNNIGLRMQYQETGEWCWIAVATSINHFYHPASTWTQCQIMTIVGQTINKFPPDTSACPSADVLAANPGLAAILADPYSKSAEFVLDNPAYRIDPEYIKSGGVSDPLKVAGNWASDQPGSLGLDQIASEVNAGRPVVAAITWFSGGSHFVAIAWCSTRSTANRWSVLERFPRPTSVARRSTISRSPRASARSTCRCSADIQHADLSGRSLTGAGRIQSDRRRSQFDPLLSVGLERSGRSRSSLCGQDQSFSLDRNQCLK